MLRPYPVAFVVLLAGLFVAAVPDASAWPRIRVLDARLQKLLEAGYAGSRTVRSLVNRLERSDVVIHVERRLHGGSEADGVLTFVGHAGGYRYLRIGIRIVGPPASAIALLAHELQHAAEIADDAGVIDRATFHALYERIGIRCRSEPGAASYDTFAARNMALRVMSELQAAVGLLP
jgi:hypothetical protein